MKTQYIIPALLFLGLSFGATAQSKTGTDTTNQNNTYVQPYSIEEPESGTEDYLFETDKESVAPEVTVIERDTNAVLLEEAGHMNSDADNNSKLENAASSTGSAIKSGGSKVGSAVKSGGKAVGKGVKKVGKTIGKGGKKAGKAIGNGASSGWQEVKEHTPGTDTREQHKAGETD